MIRKRESLNVADESARRAGKRSCRCVRAGQPLGCTAYFVFRVIADLRLYDKRGPDFAWCQRAARVSVVIFVSFFRGNVAMVHRIQARSLHSTTSDGPGGLGAHGIEPWVARARLNAIERREPNH